jgi:hypothetical protein
VKLKKDDMAALLAFSDEASFHLSGKVNHHIHAWPENPHQITKHEQDCPKVNVVHPLSQQKVYDQFFSSKT